ncbi:MAG: HlyD family efflux transporter periplasmic adaptor subunit [Xenococcus sp. (in: cyanobacteria)]
MVSNYNTHSLPPAQENEFLPPIGRWITFGGLFFVITVGISIPLAYVAKYKETVKAQASLRPAGKLRIVQAATEGQILNIAVQENQTVKKGELIATIDDSRPQTKKSQLQNSIQQAQAQLIQINAQINAIDNQRQAESDRINRTVASAKAELERREREYRDRKIVTAAEKGEAEANVRVAEQDLQRAQVEIESAKANLRSIKAAYLAAKSKHNRYQSIANQGALPLDKLEEAKLNVQQQQEAIAAQAAKVSMQQETIEQRQESVLAAKARLKRTQAYLHPSRAEVVIAEANIAQEQARGKATLATLNKEREALIEQGIEINKQIERDTHELHQVKIDLSQTNITATVDGIISQLSLRNSNQTVRVGEQVAQIVPSNAALEVKAKVSTKEIGKLEVDQDVQMRVSACPYPDYGTLKGQVKEISADAISPKMNGANVSAEQAKEIKTFYEVTIKPDSLSLGKENKQCTLQLGMEGRADIITREETVLKFILRKARLLTDL